ncbi:MAG: dTMP kinase [Nocardioidaceae bacterium]
MSSPAEGPRAVLRIRAFRRLWIGLGLSSLGDWLGLLAITAMASALADDTYAGQNFAIAGVLFLRVLPALVLGPLAGYVADRLDRRTTLVVGDVARGIVFCTIPIVHTLSWLLGATVVIEAITLVWLPVKDATVPNLVPRDRLEVANQISIATTYGSALPAAAAFVVLSLVTKGLHSTLGWLDDPVVLALYANAASFVLSGLIIATLHEIPPGPALAADDNRAVWWVVVDGWAYVARSPLVRGLVIGIAAAFAAGGVVIGLGRVYVADLGGGDPGYGLLFGAVFGGLALGMWRGPKTLPSMARPQLFGLALTAAGAALAVMAVVANLPVVTLLTLALGYLAGTAWITGYTLLGLEVDDAMRGRTFAFVHTVIRLVLALVLAVAPLLAGVIGRHRWRIDEDAVLDYNGAALTMFAAGLLLTAVGLFSYHHLQARIPDPDRIPVPVASTTSGPVYPDRGLFVALEGGEGAGKSTQARLLESWLRAGGYDVVLTHEPGDSTLGARLRQILLDPSTGMLDGRTETLLYAADKAEHVDKVVRPALARGAVVVTDRYVDSTLAYQGGGRELTVPEVDVIARWATAEMRPHLTVLLDVDPEQGLVRFDARDRIEAESPDFHRRVRASFLRLADADPGHYLVVDARQDRDRVAAQIRGRLQPLLARVGRGASVDR